MDSLIEVYFIDKWIVWFGNGEQIEQAYIDKITPLEFEEDQDFLYWYKVEDLSNEDEVIEKLKELDTALGSK